MSALKEKIEIVLLKFSANKWDILKELDASSLDSLAARFDWQEILDAILRSDSYLSSTIKSVYLELLEREADAGGLANHVHAYRGAGWALCLEGFLASEEYWQKIGGGQAQSYVSSIWRKLTVGDDLPDGEQLAAALSTGALSRNDAVRALLARPEIAERESGRLWRRLTGETGDAPAAVVQALHSKGREEAIRAICELPEFALFVERHRPVPRPIAEGPRPPEERSPLSTKAPTISAALNPYKNRPSHTYWKSGVAEPGAETDPVVDVPFSITRTDAVAAAGSCFAQHLSRSLAVQGYNALVTEEYQPQPGVVNESYGVYPARFGNIYTARQLVQLFERSYGLRVPSTDYWHGEDGRVIDPFRPRIQEGGYPSIETLLADRERHYRAVRQMFERCRVFIFTLGLTETWMSPIDGSVYPLAPGVVASRLPDDNPHFHNFSVGEVSADLERFLTLFFEINPTANVILTVSPVPLIATFEERHVLVSTVASKSILRAAVDEVCRRHAAVSYFPSYEIITGPQTGGKFYREDLREVSPEGVSFVMSVFGRHFLSSGAAPEQPSRERSNAEHDLPIAELNEEDIAKYSTISRIVCDEEFIVK